MSTSNTAQKTQMSFAGHAKALLVLGLPLIGGHIGQIAIGVTDTVMLGWYGVEELAAITLAGTYFHWFFLFGSGFAWAVMPLVASFIAQDDQVGLRRATRMGLWLSVVFSLLVLPLLIFSEPIMRLLGQGDEAARGAAEYLRIAGWGIIPAVGVMVLKSFLAGLERTQPVLWIIVIAALANAVFNYAFIFGNWGAPEMGLAGAAWASNFTNMLMLIGTVIYVNWAVPEYDLFRRIWKIDGEMMRRVFGLGLPIGLTTLSEVSLFTASALMMGWLGTLPLGAHGIVVQLAAVTFMVHMGLSNAATVRAGNALGRRDNDHLARGAIVAFALSLGFSVLTVAAFLLFPEPLISLAIGADDPARPDILRIGAGLLAVAALFQLVDGAQVIALGVLRGVQDTRVPMLMAAFSYWVIGIPCSYVFGFVFGWDGIGIWLGLVLGLSFAALLLMLRFWGPVMRGLRAS